MSDKKVIHVKDLVIKADNVIIERQGHHRDPFFGGFPRREEKLEGRMESSHDIESDDRKDDDDDRKRPFSWI